MYHFDAMLLTTSFKGLVLLLILCILIHINKDVILSLLLCIKLIIIIIMYTCIYVSVRTSVRACVGAHVLVHVRVIHLETASCPRGHIHNLHPSPCHVVNSTSKDLFFCVQLLGVSGAVLRVQGLFVDMLGHEFTFTSLVLTGQQSSSHTHRARVSASARVRSTPVSALWSFVNSSTTHPQILLAKAILVSRLTQWFGE